MIENKIRVADSAIHGKGLFATAVIKKGELLGHLQTRPAKITGPMFCGVTTANLPGK